jgi:ubiquinone/menaquinone biosynthesis C-methylase UbiE
MEHGKMEFGTEQLPAHRFKMMAQKIKLREQAHPRVAKRVESFNVKEGMIIVDYACGPGLYLGDFSKSVGGQGRVIAVDVLEEARVEVENVIAENSITNVVFYLADGYNSGIDTKTADMVFALDVFHGIGEKGKFLAELHRICRDGGILIIDDGHQPREKTKAELAESKLWEIIEETDDALRCKKI